MTKERTSNSSTSSEQTTRNGPGASAADSEAPVATRLAQTAHAAIDKAADSASRAEQTLRDGAASSEASAIEFGKQAQDVSERTLEKLREYTQAHPIESLGIAFASGVLLSHLLRK